MLRLTNVGEEYMGVNCFVLEIFFRLKIFQNYKTLIIFTRENKWGGGAWGWKAPFLILLHKRFEKHYQKVWVIEG